MFSSARPHATISDQTSIYRFSTRLKGRVGADDFNIAVRHNRTESMDVEATDEALCQADIKAPLHRAILSRDKSCDKIAAKWH